MALQVVGAGLGRTGTHSLKLALEQLLGGPCYHMVEVFPRPGHLERWTAALRGEPIDLDATFDGFVATVDWPSCGAWESIWQANPGSVVLLSTRASADEWYRSASRTIFEQMIKARDADGPFPEMTRAMAAVFGADWDDEAGCTSAYERHNAHVRATVPTGQLIEWQPADGWGPLCAALGVAEPSEPFPVTNTTDEFRAQFGMDRQG